MTLATAGADGRPSARTVLLKALDSRGFVFYTSFDSAKGRDLAANPRAALLFFWAELERQVRLVAGGIVLVGVLASTLVPRAKWVSAAVGGGLVGAALTDSCLMGMALSKLPHNRRNSPDLATVLRDLAG